MTRPPANRTTRRRAAFALVELLVVVSIIALLIAILLPSLRRARLQTRATTCLSQLRTLGQGLTMYALDHSDILLPGRMPDKGDGINWRAIIPGGMKYRPTFLATMGAYVGIPPFEQPMAAKAEFDRFGERGDRQNYANRVYVCPAVAHWTDERNGAYGYNYQFLGNSRLRADDPPVFRNWPVKLTQVRSPGDCVAVGDCTGTAASFANPREYDNNSRDADRFGNEGFNLDPPRVDPTNGEMAGFDDSPQVRTALHARHLERGSVLWLDIHASQETPKRLGYDFAADGTATFNGDNRLFHVERKDEAWVEPD